MKKYVFGWTALTLMLAAAGVAAEKGPFSLAIRAVESVETPPGVLRCEPGLDLWSHAILQGRSSQSATGRGQGYPSAGLKGEKRLSVVLHVGVGKPDWNDVNGMMNSYAELSDIVRGEVPPGLDFASSWPAVGSVLEYGAEIRFNITPRLAAGVGFGLISKTVEGYYTISASSYFTYEGIYNGEPAVFEVKADDLTGLTIRTRMTVIPWTLQAYYFVPLGRMGQAFVKGGVSFYAGKLKHGEFSREMESESADIYSALDGTFIRTDVNGEESILEYSHDSASRTLAFRGGIGLDLKLLSEVSLVIEADYNTARLKDWKGQGGANLVNSVTESGTTEKTTTPLDSFEGNLWYVGVDSGEGNLETIDMFEFEPVGLDPQRPVVIRLDGISLKAGLRIRF